MKPLLAPSVLSCNFLRLENDIQLIEKSSADWLHLDIMDGVFVPNISFGFPVLKAIQSIASKPMDVHLMIVQPERYIERFAESGASYITVHLEAVTHLHRVVHQIKNLGVKAGVALNPHTPVGLLEDIISEIDLVLIMSVNPGFGGQKFIEQSYKKIEKVKEMILKTGSQTLIEVDGGVDLQNAEKLIAFGADVLVAGHSIFSSNNPEETITKLKKLMVEAR